MVIGDTKETVLGLEKLELEVMNAIVSIAQGHSISTLNTALAMTKMAVILHL